MIFLIILVVVVVTSNFKELQLMTRMVVVRIRWCWMVVRYSMGSFLLLLIGVIVFQYVVLFLGSGKQDERG
jgi:hypothetical protein